MLEHTLIVGGGAWIVSALIYWAGMRKVILNVFDPLVVAGISVAFSAALLAVLCDTGLVSWDKFVLFSLALCAYLLGARFAGAFFSQESFRDAIHAAVSQISRLEINVVLLATVAATLVLAILGIQQEAAGDARQDFAKAFRPLVILQSGLFVLALVLLLSPKLSRSRKALWLSALVILSIPFSGKAVLIPVVLWFGLKLFLERKTVTLRVAVLGLVVVFASVGLMGVLAYGVSGLAGSLFLLTNRMWMSGDVYIYAYQLDALASIRSSYSVSFLSYMLHPVTALVGIRGYDKPLGSVMASEVAGREILTGPNPQLPVVLDFFFPEQLLMSIPVAFVIGLLVIAVRPMALALAHSRSRYVRLGGITAAVFCPSAGFLDTSQVLMALVGILAVTAAGVGVEMLLSPRNKHTEPRALRNDLPSVQAQ
jgi:hypothetical protein